MTDGSSSNPASSSTPDSSPGAAARGNPGARRRPYGKILFFTGKGGTGKSWLSQRIAAQAAEQGFRVALLEVTGASSSGAHIEGRGYTHLQLDAHKALGTLLGDVIGFSFVVRRLLESRTFTALSAAAPGLADLATLAEIAQLAKSGTYDFVLVDAPASGHALPLLTAATRIGEFITFGPIAQLAARLQKLVRDPSRFQIVVTTTAEELPVVETLSLTDELAGAQLPAVTVVANALLSQHGDAATDAWLLEHRPSEDATLFLQRRELQQHWVSQLRHRFPELAQVHLDFEGRARSDIEGLLDRVSGVFSR